MIFYKPCSESPSCPNQKSKRLKKLISANCGNTNGTIFGAGLMKEHILEVSTCSALKIGKILQSPTFKIHE